MTNPEELGYKKYSEHSPKGLVFAECIDHDGRPFNATIGPGACPGTYPKWWRPEFSKDELWAEIVTLRNGYDDLCEEVDGLERRLEEESEEYK